jgi:N-acetylglucosaminyldiphosphoundecaprenol N-acetyl-beta-D-mannosaminyltransferase
VIADRVEAAALRSEGRADDLSREVDCILGVPIDAIDMPAVVHKIERAATKSAPFLISTPNLHFLVISSHEVANPV